MNSSKRLRSRASESKRFQGFNLWAVSLNLLLLGTLLVIALRVVPGYVEYLTVKDVITLTQVKFITSILEQMVRNLINIVLQELSFLE